MEEQAPDENQQRRFPHPVQRRKPPHPPSHTCYDNTCEGGCGKKNMQKPRLAGTASVAETDVAVFRIHKGVDTARVPLWRHLRYHRKSRCLLWNHSHLLRRRFLAAFLPPFRRPLRKSSPFSSRVEVCSRTNTSMLVLVHK